MKLNVDLSLFNLLVESIVSPHKESSDFSIRFKPIDLKRLYQLHRKPDVMNDSSDDLELFDDLFHYDGYAVIVYIKEHKNLVKVERDPYKKGKKYHLTNCKTVKDEKEASRFNRFVALKYLNGKMPICNEKGEEIDVTLHVCKSCLRELNYKPYLDAITEKEKEQVCREFNLSEFLQERDCSFPEEYLPSRHAEYSSFSYAENWQAMSLAYREIHRYCCEQCSISLVSRKTLLHTHHIDGVKSNSHPTNLMALCKECHSKQPKHSNIKLSDEELSYLKELRKVKV